MLLNVFGLIPSASSSTKTPGVTIDSGAVWCCGYTTCPSFSVDILPAPRSATVKLRQLLTGASKLSVVKDWIAVFIRRLTTQQL